MRRLVYFDNFLFLIPFVFWALLPSLAYNSIMRGVAIFSLFLYLIVEINKSSTQISRRIFFIIVMSYIWFVNAYFSINDFKLRHLHYSIFLIISAFSYQLITSNTKNYRLLIYIILSLNIITNVLTIIGLSEDMNISRHLSKSNEFSKELSQKGYAGYGLVYMNVILFPLQIIYLKAKFKYTKSKKSLLLILISIVTSAVLIVKAQYSIALVVFFGYVTYISFNTFKSKLIRFLTVMLGVFVVLLSFNLQFLYSLVEGTRYSAKFDDLFLILHGIQPSDVVGSRTNAYTKSLYSFYDNIILGTFSFDNLGKHSDILDKFAQYGIFMGFILLHYIFKTPLKIYNSIKYEYKPELVSFLMALLVIATLNTITLEFSIAILFGACITIIIDKKNRKC